MNLYIVILEGLILSFFLWLICKLGIRNGAVGMVHLYDKKVQRRAVELGLTTEEKIRKSAVSFKTQGLLMYFGYIIIAVYFNKGTHHEVVRNACILSCNDGGHRTYNVENSLRGDQNENVRTV